MRIYVCVYIYIFFFKLNGRWNGKLFGEAWEKLYILRRNFDDTANNVDYYSQMRKNLGCVLMKEILRKFLNIGKLWGNI